MTDSRECIICLDNDLVIEDLLDDYNNDTPSSISDTTILGELSDSDTNSNSQTNALSEITELENLYKECPCKFLVHKECLLKWLETSPSCPVCHKEVFVIDNISVRSNNSTNTDTDTDTDADINNRQDNVPHNNNNNGNNIVSQHVNDNTQNTQNISIYNECVALITYMCCCFTQALHRNRNQDINRNINRRRTLENIELRNGNLHRRDIRTIRNLRSFRNVAYNDRLINLRNNDNRLFYSR